MTVIQFSKEFPERIFYGTTFKTTIKAIQGEPVQILGLVPCVNSGDCYELDAIGGDFSSFLFEFPQVETPLNRFKLQKHVSGSWVTQATLNDNTYGTFYDFGFYSVETYAGFKLDWSAVELAFGLGKYRFIVEDLVTFADSLFSYPYNLKSTIDKSVYIEMTMNGSYRNFNYTSTNNQKQKYEFLGQDWEDSCRYNARLEEQPLEAESTYVVYQTYKNELHYTDDKRKILFRIFEANLELYNRLVLYGLRGDNIKVTDYNDQNRTDYVQFNVIFEGESSYEYFINNPKIINSEINLVGEYDLGFRRC